MKELARSRETDTFEWEVQVVVREEVTAPSLWELEAIFDTKTVRFPRMTRGQVRLFCDALRRAILVASVKVNPLDGWRDDEL
jgi:hypothetical protein